jgi:branched-chain amino acid transport system substrate-binding protein
VISETGAAAGHGRSVRRGLDLAVEQINSDGGFEGKAFELIYRDDGTDPMKGQQAVADLISEFDVGIIIGAVSSAVTLAIAPMCEQDGVVLLSPSASAPELTGAGSYIFRNCPSDVLEASAMARFARDLGVERLAVFAVDNEFGAGLEQVFAPEFESPSRRIVASIRFREGDAAGLGERIAALTDQDPDGVYVVGYTEDVASIVRHIRDAGLGVVILAASSADAGDLVARIGAAAERVVLPRPASFDPESDVPAVQEFVAAYRERYGEDPDGFAAHGYDAAKMLLLAMQRRDSALPDEVRLGLNAIDDHPGASGTVSVDANGDAIQYPRLYVIRRGREVSYERFKQEGGSFDEPGP